MIEKVPMPLLEKDYEWPGWNVFRNQMNRDMAKLNKAATGDGKFVPFPLTYGMPEKTYVYRHSFHAYYSSIGLQQFREAGIKIITENIPVRKCHSHPKKDHYLFQPFF